MNELECENYTFRLWKIEDGSRDDILGILSWYRDNYNFQASKADKLSLINAELYDTLQQIERVANRSSVEYRLARDTIKKVNSNLYNGE